MSDHATVHCPNRTSHRNVCRGHRRMCVLCVFEGIRMHACDTCIQKHSICVQHASHQVAPPGRTSAWPCRSFCVAPHEVGLPGIARPRLRGVARQRQPHALGSHPLQSSAAVGLGDRGPPSRRRPTPPRVRAEATRPFESGLERRHDGAQQWVFGRGMPTHDLRRCGAVRRQCPAG